MVECLAVLVCESPGGGEEAPGPGAPPRVGVVDVEQLSGASRYRVEEPFGGVPRCRLCPIGSKEGPGDGVQTGESRSGGDPEGSRACCAAERRWSIRVGVRSRKFAGMVEPMRDTLQSWTIGGAIPQKHPPAESGTRRGRGTFQTPKKGKDDEGIH